jgi:hypothetical protein
MRYRIAAAKRLTGAPHCGRNKGNNMFGNIFKKLIGKGAGTVADTIVDGVLDKATGGISTALEDAVKTVKVKRANDALNKAARGGKKTR